MPAALHVVHRELTGLDASLGATGTLHLADGADADAPAVDADASAVDAEALAAASVGFHLMSGGSLW